MAKLPIEKILTTFEQFYNHRQHKDVLKCPPDSSPQLPNPYKEAKITRETPNEISNTKALPK